MLPLTYQAGTCRPGLTGHFLRGQEFPGPDLPGLPLPLPSEQADTSRSPVGESSSTPPNLQATDGD